MMALSQQAVEELGAAIPMTKLCQWFDIPRWSAYYKPSQHEPKLQERFVQPIKAMIEAYPSFGYRTAAHLLHFNSTTLSCIVQKTGRLFITMQSSLSIKCGDDCSPISSTIMSLMFTNSEFVADDNRRLGEHRWSRNCGPSIT